jgi:hypothetical protein
MSGATTDRRASIDYTAAGHLHVTDVIVLCYHAVSERWEADLAVTPSQFEAQLDFLLESGYCGATFHESGHGSAGIENGGCDI